MNRSLEQKSTVDQIRARFDADVERFSRLETGQQATIDAPLVLELVAKVAAAHLRPGGALLDLGCGAGNFTLKVLVEVAPLHCTLADLSLPMLTRARERIGQATTGEVSMAQCDMRGLVFSEGSFDVILAADRDLGLAGEAVHSEGGAVVRSLQVDLATQAGVDRLVQEIKAEGRPTSTRKILPGRCSTSSGCSGRRASADRMSYTATRCLPRTMAGKRLAQGRNGCSSRL